MKVSQLISGLLLVSFLVFSPLGLYVGLTEQPKDWLLIACSLFLLFYSPYVYLRRSKGKIKKTPYLKGNTLNIDVEAQEAFRAIVALGIVGFGIVFLFKLPSGLNILGFALALIGAYIYKNSNPAPGVYKNGKYLGNIYKGFIKVGDSLAVGKRQDTGTIGFLKVLKDGKVVVFLTLTPEGFMELKPDKIWEVFPEIKGKIERFGNMFKVGDYTLEYNLLSPSKNISYSYYKEVKTES